MLRLNDASENDDVGRQLLVTKAIRAIDKALTKPSIFVMIRIRW